MSIPPKILPVKPVVWEGTPLDQSGLEIKGSKEMELDLSMTRLMEIFAPIHVSKYFTFHLRVNVNGNVSPRYVVLWSHPAPSQEKWETALCVADLEKGFKQTLESRESAAHVYFLSAYDAERKPIIINHPVKIQPNESLIVSLLPNSYKIRILGALRV